MIQHPTVVRECAELRGAPFDAYPLLELPALPVPAAVPVESRRPTRAARSGRCACCDGVIVAGELVIVRADRALLHTYCVGSTSPRLA